MKIKTAIVRTIVALMLLTPGTAYAWGDEGHETVAYIADAYLTPEARQQVMALLAQDQTGLVANNDIGASATWADRYRDSDRNTTKQRYLQTQNWHYVNAEISGTDITMEVAAACYHYPPLANGVLASSGPANDCAVSKIVEFEGEVADTTLSARERVMALEFLLHLVGDVHQPLHAADNQDQGGNLIMARGPNFAANTLHHHWDTTFVEMLGKDPHQLATGLVGTITADQIATWTSADPAQWAAEAHELAITDAYHLPQQSGTSFGKPNYVLDQNYSDQAAADVALQLKRAGVRLANVLNKAFSNRTMAKQ